VNATAGVAFQPNTKKLVRQGIFKGSNPQAIDIDRASYFWTALQLAWSSETDDEYMHEFATHFTAIINDLLNRADFGARYLFLNEELPVFQSYGAENLRKLKEI
jgi:hypothetical protein